MSMRSLRLALYIFAGFWFGGLAAFTLFPAARERLLPSLNVRSVGQALVGGPFTLTDQTGKRVTDRDFRGKFLLVFFGFTNCPDVCPTALQVMAAALDKLGPNAERVTPVLISVDPEHDTPARARHLRGELPPAARRAHRIASGDRRRGEGLSRLRQESARSRSRRPATRSITLRSSTSWDRTGRTGRISRTRPVPTSWPSACPACCRDRRCER